MRGDIELADGTIGYRDLFYNRIHYADRPSVTAVRNVAASPVVYEAQTWDSSPQLYQSEPTYEPTYRQPWTPVRNMVGAAFGCVGGT